MENKAVLVLVRGRVQGVGFRYEARNLARTLGINGWICNLPDGGVETYAEGPSTALERFTQWLSKGPPGASVSSVDVTNKQYTGTYNSFTIELQ